MIKVREVKVGDWDKLRDMLEELVNEKPPVALELEPLIQKGKQWVLQFPKENLGYFVIAEDKGKIIGFCYLAVPQFYKPMCYIGIAIIKSYRKKDIGSQLFYEVASWAASKHLQYILADIWAWNINSIEFFENLRFERKETFKDKFKGEERDKVRLVMRL